MNFRNSKEKLTNEDIVNFEQNFRLQLPKSYVKTILDFNGGYPEKSYFRGAKIYFLPIKYGNWNLEKCITIGGDIYPNKSLPFAEFAETSYYISLVNGDNYGKIYWMNESGETELVSNSFEEFMDELSDNEDY